MTDETNRLWVEKEVGLHSLCGAEENVKLVPRFKLMSPRFVHAEAYRWLSWRHYDCQYDTPGHCCRVFSLMGFQALVTVWSSHRTLLLVLLVLRLDRGARLFPVGVGPGEELVERAAVDEAGGAVDGDGLAGEELAAVRHEEGGEVLQLFHFPRAPHRVDRRGVPARVAAGREALAGAFRREDPRCDGVDADPVAAPFDRVRLRHDVHGRLRHRGGHDEWGPRPHPSDDDRDDRTLVAARDPALADRVSDVEGAVQHGVGDGVEAARGEVLGARDEVTGGVVEKAGERPAVLPDRLHHRVHAFCVADVRGVALDRAAVPACELRGRPFERLPAPPEDVEIGAELEVLRRHLASEPRAATRDEDALALEKVFAEHGLDGQYDLADVPARFHQLVRLRGFGEREGPVDDRLDPAGFDQRPEFLTQVPRDRALELDRARAQRRARHRQAPAQDVAEEDCRLAAAEEGDDDDAAVIGEALQLAVDVLAPDHVEDHIDAAPSRSFLHRGHEILGRVGDGAVGAELHAGPAFLRAARRREHLVAEGFHDLNRGDADSARSALHEKRFTGPQTRAIEHVAPHGEEGLGQGGGFDGGHALRDRQALRSGRRAVLGVAAALDERGHPIADAPSRDAFADRRDATRELQPRNVGRARRHRIVAGALHGIGAVDAGGGDRDEELARLRLRNGARADSEHLRSSRLGDLDREHGLWDRHVPASKGSAIIAFRQNASRSYPCGFPRDYS